ncbi:MAG: GNAT family N-acetyltransferase [Betaproteobacteria bacterium]|nr:GNAT family N-acetyltransferase [Betaproteobacteria bacterium]
MITDDHPSHASAFQALRLFGLRESPTSFGSSYEEEHSRTDPQIVAHLVGSPERKFLGCFNDAELAGVVGVGREQSVKERHIAFVRSMYVTPTARRQGVGLQLMLNAIACAAAWDGVEQITLSVTASNHAAVGLYQSVGFWRRGTDGLPNSLRSEGLPLQVRVRIRTTAPGSTPFRGWFPTCRGPLPHD